MKNLVEFVRECLGFKGAFAQTDFTIHSNNKGVYLEHKVEPKQGLYAVSRLYNVPVATIASFNDFSTNKGLNIDEVIHVPLVKANFIHTGTNGAPIYYVVKQGETLSKVAGQLNVPVNALKQWNNEQLQPGDKIVVGLLKSNELKGSLSSVPASATVSEKPATAIQEKETVATTAPAVVPAKDIIKEQEKPAPVKTTASETIAPATTTTTILLDKENSFFAPHYREQIITSPVSKNLAVVAGTFKTTSGWQDSKFYVLIDNVTPGTIIAVSNPSNNKVVYAKVLGKMEGIRQNQGYDIRINAAAAALLGINENTKTTLQVAY